MFRLIRNVHLILGLTFVFFGLIFSVSSLVIINRPRLPEKWMEPARTVQVERTQATSPRELALELMRNHGLAGELRRVKEQDDLIRFEIARPGTESDVEYVPSSGEVKIETRRWNWLETFVELHINHGFHHEFLPANAWALLSLLGSTALLLLGATGIYLWFSLYEERLVGSIFLVLGLACGLTSLVWSRMLL